MKVVALNTVPKKHLIPQLFIGKALFQSPVTEHDGSDLAIHYVHFSKGVRSKFHKHSNDQVLIVTRGKGIVATKTKKVNVTKGDVIWAPAGEVHWHGATRDSDFTHISVTRAHTKLTQIEK